MNDWVDIDGEHSTWRETRVIEPGAFVTIRNSFIVSTATPPVRVLDGGELSLIDCSLYGTWYDWYGVAGTAKGGKVRIHSCVFGEIEKPPPGVEPNGGGGEEG